MATVYRMMLVDVDPEVNDEYRHYSDFKRAVNACKEIVEGCETLEARLIEMVITKKYTAAERACRLLDGYGYCESNKAIAVFKHDGVKWYDNEYRELGRQAQEDKATA